MPRSKKITLSIIFVFCLISIITITILYIQIYKSRTVYQASSDWAENNVQGYKGWYYQCSKNNTDEYNNISRFQVAKPDDYWFNPDNLQMGNNWQHASHLYNSARVWVAPSYGKISISSIVKLYEPDSDGVKIYIKKKNKENFITVYGPVILNFNNPLKKINISLNTEKNDRIYFIVDKNMSFSPKERVDWDPKITLKTSGRSDMETIQEPLQARQWKAVEIQLNAQGSYTNPYKDIVADAVFTCMEDGTHIKRPLFWDGGNTWKIRFAPTKPGLWNWRVEYCSVPDDGIMNVTGIIDCKAPDTNELPIYKKGFLKIYKNPEEPNDPLNGKFLTYADGTPFFWVSYTMTNMCNGYSRWTNNDPNNPDKTLGDFQMVVDKAVEDRYNVIKANADDWWSMGLNKEHNPNPAIWPCGTADRMERLDQEDMDLIKNELDYRMEYIAKKGLVINFGFIYAMAIYMDETGDGSFEDRLQGFKDWGRYLIGRYGAYPMVFSPGHEMPWYDNEKAGLKQTRTNKYIDLYNHLFTYLEGYQLTGGLFINSEPVSRSASAFGDSYNDDMVNLPAYQVVMPMQSLYPEYDDLSADFEDVIQRYMKLQPKKPIILEENFYTGQLIYGVMATTDEHQQLNQWKSAQVGCGIDYADIGMAMGTYGDILWYEHINLPRKDIAKKLINFYTDKNLPWWKLLPKFGDSWATWSNPETYPLACKPYIKSDYYNYKGCKENNIVIYYPKNSPKNGTLHNVLGGSKGGAYNVWWFNPNSGNEGTYIPDGQVHVIEHNDSYDLVLPSKPSSDPDNDWVLWLTTGPGPCSP